MPRYYGGTSLLPGSLVRTGAKAEAEIIQTQAGRARWFVEYLSGVQTDDTTTANPPIMNTPHGQGPGHDHSGGVMGVPIVRTLWWTTFGYDSTYLGSTINNGGAVQNTLTSATVAQQQRMYIYNGSFKNVWVPGCPPDSIAHREATVCVGMYYNYTDAGAAMADTSLTAYFRMTGMDGRSISYNKNMTTTATQYDFEFDDKVSLVPGVCNRIAFECWIPASAQGAGDSKTASLLYVTLNQTTTGP